jgi:hypothetical protein
LWAFRDALHANRDPRLNGRPVRTGSIVEGVIRILTTLTFAIAIALGTPSAAHAASPAVAPTPAPSASAGPSTPSTNDARIGGTPGQPEPAKPGWVWWIGAAIVVAFGAGGIRLWRNRWLDHPPTDNPSD